MSEIRKIEDVQYHRNGISGEPFYAVTFIDSEKRPMVGIVFDYDENLDRAGFYNPRTAVFERDLLGKGVITFGVNSWRGDNYHSELLAAIRKHDAEQEAKWATNA